MGPRRPLLLAACVGLLGSAVGARAAEEQAAADDQTGPRRLTLSVEALHLFVPALVVKAELAAGDRWGVALRGGAGETSSLGERDSRVVELGAQVVYYPGRRFDRGLQLGADFRWSRVEQAAEGTTTVFGLGDGTAAGPFVGYKRAYDSGLTLEAQGGAQLTTGQADESVLPYVGLSIGWSFGGSRGSSGGGGTPVVPRPDEAGEASPLDHHRGVLLGVAVGGGSIAVAECDGCDVRPGIGVDASLGLFLSRRFALMYDATAATSVSGTGTRALASSLQSVALQWWPADRVWLKLGVGYARLLETGPLFAVDRNGGGMTVAAGYELHQNEGFAMDLRVRATHGSYGPEAAEMGVDAFTALLGFNWY